MATAKKAAGKPATSEPADWETIAKTSQRGWRETQTLLASAVHMLATQAAQINELRTQINQLRTPAATLVELMREEQINRRLRTIATKLRDGLRAELGRASEAAKKPRKRTARMRAQEASFYRERLAAWVREEGTRRGYLASEARAVGVTPKTLRDYMQPPESPEGAKRKRK